MTSLKDLPDVPRPGDITALKRLYRLHENKKAYLLYKSIENNKDRFSLLDYQDLFMLYQIPALALQYSFADDSFRDIFPTELAQAQEIIRLYNASARAIGCDARELFKTKYEDAEAVLKAFQTDDNAADFFRKKYIAGHLSVTIEKFLTPETSDEEDNRDMDIDIKEDDEDNTKRNSQQA